MLLTFAIAAVTFAIISSCGKTEAQVVGFDRAMMDTTTAPQADSINML